MITAFLIGALLFLAAFMINIYIILNFKEVIKCLN